MITVPGTRRTRRTNQSMVAARLRREAEAARQGRRVIVIKRGIYNGPNHKSLGLKDVGDVIRVASGPYADSLIADGLVADFPDDPVAEDAGRPPADTPAQPTLTPEPAPEPATPKLGEGSPDFGAPEPEQPKPEPEPAAGAAPWQVFVEAGLYESAAKALYEAGIDSKRAVAEAYAARGLAALTDIKGIGPVKAAELLAWAGVTAT